MTDESYVFYSDIREKKKTATGARHVKRGSRSKKCTLPSDYLSRKEIEKMNGEATTVKLNEPMSWNEFIHLSKNLQEHYLNHLIVNHGATISSISTDLFERAKTTLPNYVRKHELSVDPVRRRSGKDIQMWQKFLKKKNLTFDTSKIVQAENTCAPWGSDARPMVTSALDFDFTLDNVTDWDELRKLIARLEGISLEEGYRITLRVRRSGE